MNLDLTDDQAAVADLFSTFFARESTSEVVRSALRLLQDLEEQRRQFTAMLDEAVEEADREGTFTVEEVLAELDQIIDSPQE